MVCPVFEWLFVFGFGFGFGWCVRSLSGCLFLVLVLVLGGVSGL